MTGAPPSSPFDNAANRSFASQTGPLYISFLFRPVAGGSSTDDDFFQFILNDDTDQENSGAVGMRNITGTGGNDGYFARIRNNSADASAEATPNILSVVGRTDFLVGKFSKVASTTYNRFELFVNPTSDVEGTPVAVLNSDSLSSALSFFTLRLASLESGDSYQFDELRIGTTFADVVPTIPEPASLSMGALGLLALTLRRRNA